MTEMILEIIVNNGNCSKNWLTRLHWMSWNTQNGSGVFWDTFGLCYTTPQMQANLCSHTTLTQELSGLCGPS